MGNDIWLFYALISVQIINNKKFGQWRNEKNVFKDNL